MLNTSFTLYFIEECNSEQMYFNGGTKEIGCNIYITTNLCVG